jgi:uncharacterized repeat protein (TIGR03806 family)
LLVLGACGETRAPVTPHAADSPPLLLSEWGVVIANGKTLSLNTEVLPYELNTPLFSDYALKLRSVWMPAGATASYRTDGPMDFPIGTIISKTFFYEKAGGFDASAWRVVKAEREARLDAAGQLSLDTHVLVETRLLVHYETGWKAFPYVWNTVQDDATLEVAGEIRSLALVDEDGAESFNYIVPDANQCSGCHTTDHASKALQPIGPTARQLNREYTYGETTHNQLQYWASENLLSGVEAQPPLGINWLLPGDATLEARSKAYLDVNCAHCHNSVGAADTSGLDLSLSTEVGRDYGLCKPPVAVGRGSGDRPYDIFPGQPVDSIMIYRMEHTDPAIAMPELGRSTVHSEAIDLLSAWVTSLPGSC